MLFEVAFGAGVGVAIGAGVGLGAGLALGVGLVVAVAVGVGVAVGAGAGALVAVGLAVVAGLAVAALAVAGLAVAGLAGGSAPENQAPAVDDAASQVASPRTLTLTDSQLVVLPVAATMPVTLKLAEAPGSRSAASGAARSTTDCGSAGSPDDAVTVTSERAVSASGSRDPGAAWSGALGIVTRPVFVMRTTAPVPSWPGCRS